MAITGIEYAVISRLKAEGLLVDQPAVLEIGRSNWYGDVDLRELIADIGKLVEDKSERENIISTIRTLKAEQPDSYLYDLADIFWKVLVNPGFRQAVDLDGATESLQLNLNEPVKLDRQYDLVCNFGTAEHIFNVYQVYKTIHEVTYPGGLMLHGTPFQGWIDHGFYTFQPTFYFDLAEANDYHIHSLVYAEILPHKIIPLTNRSSITELVKNNGVGDNAMLYAVLKKAEAERPFCSPTQGYYNPKYRRKLEESWRALR